jgi:Mg-chelatase subunit ChlD
MMGDSQPTARSYFKAVSQVLDRITNRGFKGAVVWMSERSSARLAVPLTADRVAIQKGLNPPLGGQTSSYHAYRAAFDIALGELESAKKDGPRITAVAYMGAAPNGAPPIMDWPDWYQSTKKAKGQGHLLIIGCTWIQPTCDRADGTNPERDAASPGWFAEGYRQDGVYGGLIKRFLDNTRDTVLSSLDVDEILPPGASFLPDSIAPAPSVADATTRHLRWEFKQPIGEALTLTYKVRLESDVRGTLAFTRGLTSLVDSFGRSRTTIMPTSLLTVTGPCPLPAETPTPTSTTIPTPSPSPTSTATPPPTLTPRASATPTPKPTRLPQPAFLPLTLRESCTPTQRRMDVVLAIDTSSSMRQPTRTGRSKLDAARAAATVFLDQVDWAGGNQAAIVTFDATARLAQPLTGDRGLLNGALGGMATGQQTCLPCAVAEADRELASARHQPGHTPVLVLLTDGRSNPRPVSEAVAAAETAKARGVVIFTIGVGEDVDEAGLASMASRPDYYYRAPDAEALEAIYRAVAVTIPCPPGSFWGGR